MAPGEVRSAANAGSPNGAQRDAHKIKKTVESGRGESDRDKFILERQNFTVELDYRPHKKVSTRRRPRADSRFPSPPLTM